MTDMTTMISCHRGSSSRYMNIWYNGANTIGVGLLKKKMWDYGNTDVPGTYIEWDERKY